jgi:acylphosphatase
MTKDVKSVRVRISGRVQGVWYRGWVVREATRLRLNGWVRNRADGSVEAVFHGASESIDNIAQKCWEGPSGAHIKTIDIAEETEVPDDGFYQAPNA